MGMGNGGFGPAMATEGPSEAGKYSAQSPLGRGTDENEGYSQEESVIIIIS